MSFLGVLLGAKLACRHFAPVPQVPPAREATPSMSQVDAKALEGDLREGLRLLAAIPPDSLGPRERDRQGCMLARFSKADLPDPGLADPFVNVVVRAYFRYWTDSLLQRRPPAETRRDLLTDLRQALARSQGKGSAWDAMDLDQVTEALGPVLEVKGFHSIRGVTRPYYDLLLWRKETTHTYEVHLPEGLQHVTVVFLSDFLLHGWEGFATCGWLYPGGWTTPKALYCDADSYDLESEAFRVSYLAHEGQHFHDLKRFPGLDGPELEYRAKLVELALADQSLQALLEQFQSRMGEDPRNPHAYANARVIHGLWSVLRDHHPAPPNPFPWHEIGEARIHAAARDLLRKDTEALERARKDLPGVNQP